MWPGLYSHVRWSRDAARPRRWYTPLFLAENLIAVKTWSSADKLKQSQLFAFSIFPFDKWKWDLASWFVLPPPPRETGTADWLQSGTTNCEFFFCFCFVLVFFPLGGSIYCNTGDTKLTLYIFMKYSSYNHTRIGFVVSTTSRSTNILFWPRRYGEQSGLSESPCCRCESATGNTKR